MQNRILRVARTAKRSVWAVAAVISVCAIAGCHLEHPDQDNYLLDASRNGVAPFLQHVSANFDAKTKETPIRMTGDPTTMYTFETNGIVVVVVPLPDDRCNTNAGSYATFDQRQYRIDILYETKSRFIRNAAKQLVIASATQATQPLTTFKECFEIR
jgi:hypothetical protein